MKSFWYPQQNTFIAVDLMTLVTFFYGVYLKLYQLTHSRTDRIISLKRFFE